jgi:succinate dehydrogenase / fumarate reductase membrane anchor subunit
MQLTIPRRTTHKQTLESRAWKYMRLSSIFLVPLVWFHTILNTLIVGSQNVDLDLVSQRWTNLGWQVYDILLLAFAFSHGVNGLRQVLFDFTSSSTIRRALNILLLLFWILLSVVGASAIIGDPGQ